MRPDWPVCSGGTRSACQGVEPMRRVKRLITVLIRFLCKLQSFSQASDQLSPGRFLSFINNAQLSLWHEFLSTGAYVIGEELKFQFI